MKIASSVMLVLLMGQCGAKITEIDLPANIQDCYNKVQLADTQSYVGSLYSWLCESTIKQSQLGEPPKFDAQKTSYYQQLLDKSLSELPNTGNGTGWSRHKRQAVRSRCVRKEYRTLSDEQRSRFHSAVNALKHDTSVAPNKYDAIAMLHELAVFSAHSGAGFFGWHRVYLVMFETALREVDSSVCLPYWDSSLDNELDDPILSHVWTSAFFGTARGAVVSGPFANWTTPKGSQLIRNVGTDGELFTSTAVEDILSRTRYEDIIASAEVEPRFDLEFHHGGVHVFCGGAMSQLDTAAYDPIFFLHHAFVDYLWYLFRIKLRATGVDPEQYPQVPNANPRHHGTANTGFSDIRQADAYREILAETFEYEPSPVCSSSVSDCGSRYLTCRQSTGRCVPINPDTVVPTQPEPITTSNPMLTPGPVPYGFPGNSHTTCSGSEANILDQPVQNDFCCDNTCDSSEWASIAVKIISVRPPKFHKYRSYPVHNGHVDTKDDIYSPSAYAQTNRYIAQRTSNPKTYKRCAGDESTGHVFLSSRGINYNGFYKEVAIVDQRLAVSFSVGFVAVKRPTQGISKALIRAHDSCGRICHAACKDPATNQYKKCKGAIAINSEYPLMYGITYDEAVMNVFDYNFSNDLPQFNTDSFFLTFYCDYHNDFPYADRSVGATAPHVVKPVPDVSVTASSECQVSSQCVLDVPCASVNRQCKLFNEKHVCRGSCQAYGHCTYGRYFLKICPEGQYFDDSVKSCVTGHCQNIPGSERILADYQFISGNINSPGVKRHPASHISNVQTARYHTNLLSNVLKQLVG